MPSEPVAVLALEPDELSERLGLQFVETFDDLDYVKLSVLELSSGRRVALIRHLRSPAGGTIVAVTPKEAQDPAALREAVSALGFGEEELTWVHPDLASHVEVSVEPPSDARARPLSQAQPRRPPG